MSSLRCIIHVPKAEAAPWEDTHATAWNTQMESVLLDDSEREFSHSVLTPQMVAQNQGGETDTGCQPNGVKSRLWVGSFLDSSGQNGRWPSIIWRFYSAEQELSAFKLIKKSSRCHF